MEDHFGKYLRLFGSIFLLVIGGLLTLILLLLGAKLLFGLLSYISWISYVYMIFILLVPSILFISIYIVYFKRTRSHPVKIIRWISYLLFSAALTTWLLFLILDIQTFFKYAYNAIGMYRSYDMVFLASNVAGIFLVGVLQAFTSEKEKDWMENYRNNEELK